MENLVGISFGRWNRCGIRPALLFSSLDLIPRNISSSIKEKNGVLEVDYGYYPQDAAPKEIQEELENIFQDGKLLETGNSYTTDSNLDAIDGDEINTFRPRKYQEYEYKSKRYVRVQINTIYVQHYTWDHGVILSNGEEYINGAYVWIEVLPLKWLIDEKSRRMITEKVILSGVIFTKLKDDDYYFNPKYDYYTNKFHKTTIKRFMNKYLSKEIEQGVIIVR